MSEKWFREPPRKEPPPEIYEASFLEMFEEKILICPMSGCHLWVGSKRGAGIQSYGNVYVGGKTYRAHRISWWLHRTRYIPELIAHRCDVPACVNPDHLFLATAAENMQDCIDKLRHPRLLHYPRRAEVLANSRKEPEGLVLPPGPIFLKLL